MNLDCMVLSTAYPRVFEEMPDEVGSGLSTEKAKKGKGKRSEEKRLKPWLLGFVLAVGKGAFQGKV